MWVYKVAFRTEVLLFKSTPRQFFMASVEENPTEPESATQALLEEKKQKQNKLVRDLQSRTSMSYMLLRDVQAKKVRLEKQVKKYERLRGKQLQVQEWKKELTDYEERLKYRKKEFWTLLLEFQLAKAHLAKLKTQTALE